MSVAFETVIRTNAGERLSVSDWDDGGAWFSLMTGTASISAVLSREEATKLIAGLALALTKEAK